MMIAALDRWERDDNCYCDPASERYAAQLASVVFGWGTWHHLEGDARGTELILGDDVAIDSSRFRAFQSPKARVAPRK